MPIQSASHQRLVSNHLSYLQELIDIVADIVVDEFRVEASEVGVIDVFENEGWRFTLH